MGLNSLPIAGERHCGVTFGFYARNGYFDSEAARREVDRMTELNVRWVCLVVTVMQETAASPRMFADYEVTPGDLEIAGIIDYIHERGMKVHLRPMIECFDGHGRTEVSFPNDDAGRIPGLHSDCYARWFASMRARTRHYARLAQKLGCEMYGLDSELDRFPHRTAQWREVVDVARSHYDGPVTSSHTHMVDFVKELRNGDHWFRDLDVLGTSFYHRSADAHGATVPERMERLRPTLDTYREIARLLGKPVMFGECGCTSSYGGGIDPWRWSGQGGYEPSEQAGYLEAVLRLYWEEPWWAGLYWWKWDEQNHRPQFLDDPAGDKGFTLYGKPAGDVMRDWFGRADEKAVTSL